jgi:F0F1-type ATP synthase membrane subunit b/b'
MHQSPLQLVFPYILNFSIFVGLIVYFTRKPFAVFLYQRHANVKDAVESAKKEAALVEARVRAVEAALKNFQQDADNIWNQERRESKEESRVIEERTTQESARIDLDGERIIENEARERDAKVLGAFVNLITSATESKLKKNLRREDHSGLIGRASRKIEASV